MIFVFGSNLAGRHGAGAALHARKHHGAVYGCGQGRTGNAYAIPTKDEKLRTLPLDRIQSYVSMFIEYARMTPQSKFQVTAIGTGLAGYRHEDIAPMFKDAPCNCQLPDEWKQCQGRSMAMERGMASVEILAARIAELESERSQLEHRIKTVNALLQEKYKDWHAAQFAARAKAT